MTIRLTHHEAGYAVIEVVDRGIGVPEAEIPKLATRFFRASNAVDAEITGTGLGLRIAQTDDRRQPRRPAGDGVA